jgi:hypothetical protein
VIDYLVNRFGMRVWRFLALLVLPLAGLNLMVDQIAADDGRENQAALVIDFGNGEIETRCISFSEDEINGYEALVRSQIPVEIDFQSGGQAVCRISHTGCPIEDCFCSCRGGNECAYWSYWHLTDGRWNYSTSGAGMYRVRDGAVEGWSWGPGVVSSTPNLPLINFSEICSHSAIEITNNNDPVNSDSQSTENWFTYVSLLSILLILAALGWLGHRRTGKPESN